MSLAPAPPPAGSGPGAPGRLSAAVALLQYLVTAIVIGGVATVAYMAGFQTSDKVAAPADTTGAAANANVDIAALYKPTPELIVKGKAAFKTNCTSCHGLEGLGDGPAATALNPKPRNFHEGYWHYGGGVARVVRTISEGSPGTAMPAFVGIPLADRISLAHFVRSLEPKLEADKPEDLAWLGLAPDGTRLAGGAGKPAAAAVTGPTIPVEEALKKLAEPEPAAGVALTSLPAEAGAAGAALYEARCASCHGRTGEGGVRVKILGSAPYVYILSRSLGAGTGDWAAAPARFEKLILEGVPGTVMPGNGDLTRDVLRSLYIYAQRLRAQQQAAGRARS